MNLIKKIAFRILRAEIDKMMDDFDDEYMSLFKEYTSKYWKIRKQKECLEEQNKNLSRIIENRKNIRISIQALKTILDILPDSNEMGTGQITNEWFETKIKNEFSNTDVKIEKVEVADNGLKISLFDKEKIEVFIPVVKRSFQYNNNSNITLDTFLWDFSNIDFQVFNNSVLDMYIDYFKTIEKLFNNGEFFI